MKQPESPKLSSKARLGPARKSVRPTAIDVSEADLVDLSYLDPDRRLPVVVKPRLDHINLATWIKNNLDFVETQLLNYGALLFRDFNLRTQADFEQFIEVSCDHIMPYMESATPRTRLNDKVYTSTEFPADQVIALHNELSYVRTFPMKIMFFCLRAADQGGETPLADVRKVLQRIPAKIKEVFREKGWMLVRNFGDGFGLPWQTAYHTDDRAEVEEYFRQAGITFEWKEKDRLRTRQTRPAITAHPRTGDLVWFNHIAFWHISSLGQNLSQMLLAEFEDDAVPYNTFYGDGSPIALTVIDELREAYRQETSLFPWREGDLLMMDNMLVAHGRTTYIGPRRILVSMGEPHTRTDI